MEEDDTTQQREAVDCTALQLTKTAAAARQTGKIWSGGFIELIRQGFPVPTDGSKHDGGVQSKRFVVIKDDLASGSTLAVPIQTYNKKGRSRTDAVDYKHVRPGGLSPGRQPNDNSALHHATTSTSAQQSRTGGSQTHSNVPTEPIVDCKVNGIPTTAFPDNGADANYISETEARRRKLLIDCRQKFNVKLASGGMTTTLGTVNLRFSFRHEHVDYNLTFHVVKRCIQDMIIGSPFLQYTQTLTNHCDRITRVFRKPGVCRIRFIGAPRQRLFGYLDNKPATALPDTGADLCLASESYALQNGWVIDHSQEHCVPVEFSDGSRGCTIGIVRDLAWQFSCSDMRQHYSDIYIYRNLECPLILGYDFLCGSDAFRTHVDSFGWLDDGDSDSLLGHLSIIKISQDRADGRRRLRDLFKIKQVNTSTLVTAANQQDVVLPNTNVSFRAESLQDYHKAEREMLRRKEALERKLADSSASDSPGIQDELDKWRADWYLLNALRPKSEPPTTSTSASKSGHLGALDKSRAISGSVTSSSSSTEPG